MSDHAVQEPRQPVISQPIVSVIVPTYNVAPFIAETLESILGQAGVSAIEVVVVDDGSQDGTPDVVLQMATTDPRLHLLRNDGPRGAASARNHGLRHASGEWVAFLDGDDLWMPDNLRLKLEAAHSDPSIQMVSSDFYNENRANRTVPKAEWPGLRQSLLEVWHRHVGAPPEAGALKIQTVDRLLERFLTDEVLGNTGTFLIRRQAVEALGGFDLSLTVGEDLFLWLQLAERAQRMLFVHQPLMYYRYRPGSLTNSADAAHAVNAERFCRVLLQKQGFGAYRPLIKNRLVTALTQQCYHYRKVGDWHSALSAAFRLLRTAPAQASSWKMLAASVFRR